MRKKRLKHNFLKLLGKWLEHYICNTDLIYYLIMKQDLMKMQPWKSKVMCYMPEEHSMSLFHLRYVELYLVLSQRTCNMGKQNYHDGTQWDVFLNYCQTKTDSSKGIQNSADAVSLGWNSCDVINSVVYDLKKGKINFGHIWEENKISKRSVDRQMTTHYFIFISGFTSIENNFQQSYFAQ